MPRYLCVAAALGFAAAFGAAVGAGCGDNLRVPDANIPAEVLAQLQALPNVHDATLTPTAQPGFRYYVLHVTQPVDHADPSGPAFLQEVSLLHKDTAAPLVVQTSGYWDYYLDSPVELTELLGANQISIEHRFFGSSRPDPADWSKLTIEQMAEDEHAIVSALASIYPGPKVATGGSKGGMTAAFYRRFFPDDVVGTVPYVAPMMFSTTDPRYAAYIAQVGTADCRAAVRATAVELLQNRRAAMVAAAAAEAAAMSYAYTRVLIGPAVESAVVGLEWSFWQYYGISYCSMVPDPGTASDDEMFTFLNAVSPISESDDAEVAQFEGWIYQAFFQLGYPDDGTEDWLAPYEMYGDDDYAGAYPAGAMPTYDGGAAMHDIDSWVGSQGDRMLFEYGQWDPWSGGMYTLGAAPSSAELVEPEGTHGSDLLHLAPDDQATAFALLQQWTGVAPNAPPMTTTRVAPPRVRLPHPRGHRGRPAR